MTEIAIGTQPRALSARQGGAGTREDLGLNKEKKGGIIDGEWEWECSERMEGMKCRRCLIHFESKDWRRKIILSRLKSMATGSDL